MKIPGGHDYDIIYLRPSQIKYAPYQRKIKEKQVERISNAFDGDVFNEPKISYRDGVYWCYNGQHSIAAWQRKFGDKPMPCKVRKGMTYAEEAALFGAQDGVVTKLQALDFFNAKVEAGDKNMLNVKRGAEAAGYEIGTQNRCNPRRITAVNALIDAYDMLGYKGYTEMMQTIRKAWPDNVDAIRGNIIGGMALFYSKYYGEFQNAELVKSLRRPGSQPIDIMNYARALGANHKKYIARAILTRYNIKRTTHRLVDEI